jgi:hypothetical protein
MPAIGLIAVILLVLALAAYWNSFGTSFVFDDLSSIQRNDAVHTGAVQLVGTRSLLYLTFALNYMLGGLNVWGYHGVNFLLHLGNGLLVLQIGRQLFREIGFGERQSRIYAALASALFLVHPVQTEAVTYISSRSELLSTLFYLAGFVVFLRWPRQRSAFACSGIVLVLYLVGLSAKETVITLPATILAYDFLFRANAMLTGMRERWRFYLPFLAITPAAIYFLVTNLLRNAIGSDLVGNLSAWHYFLTQSRVVMRYIRLLFLPTGLNLDYDFAPSLSISEPAVLVSIAFLAGVLAFGWMLRKRSPLAAFSIFWFFITLSPTSSFVPINDVIFEHRLYLPLAAVCYVFPLLIGYVCEKVRGQAFAHSATVMIGTALVIFCVVGSFERNTVWKTEVSLWTDVVAKSPNKYRPHMHLASGYQVEERYPDAIREFQASERLAQSRDLPEEERMRVRQMAETSVAVLLIQMGEFDRAVEVATPVWKQFPGLPGIGASLAAVALQQRHPQEAIQYIDESLKAIDEGRWKGGSGERERGYLYRNKGEAFKLMGNCEQAISLYKQAAAVDSDLVVPSCP